MYHGRRHNSYVKHCLQAFTVPLPLSAVIVEYADNTSAEGEDSFLPRVSWFDKTACDDEAAVLRLLGILSTSLVD